MPAGRDRPARDPRREVLRRTAASAVFVVLAACPLPAAARSAPAPLGLSVQPGLSGETTLPDGHFTYALPPGARVADALVVESSEPAPVRVTVYGADLLSIGGGGVAPAAAGQPMHGVGRWLTVPALPEPVPGGGRLRVPFTLAVPSDAAPGSYDGAVVAQGPVGTTGTGIPVGVRLALVVHVIVVSGAAPVLTLGPVTASRDGGPYTLAVTLRNTGNVNLGLAGAIALRDPAGIEVDRVPLGPAGLYVVPGGSAVLRGSFVWPRKLRRVTATAVVATTVGAQPGPTYSGRPQVLTRPGASTFAVVAATAAVIAAAGFAFRRRPRTSGGEAPSRNPWPSGVPEESDPSDGLSR